MSSMRIDAFHTGLEMKMPELAFTTDKTIAQLKENFYRRTGTEPKSMELWLVDSVGRRTRKLDDDEETLGTVFPPEDQNGGVSVHIVDTDSSSLSASNALLEGDVPKYEAPHGRKDFAEFRKGLRQEKGSPPVPTAATGMAEAAEYDEGDRVIVLKDQLKGTIRYIGKCALAAPGFFCGVELDEPKGKHDGTVKGKKLFDCAPGHGILVRPYAVRKMAFSDLGDDREEL